MPIYTEIQHKVISNGHIHRIANWTVADIPARNALPVTSEDELKVCYVESSDSMYFLSSAAPLLWTSLGSGSGSGGGGSGATPDAQLTLTPVAGTIDLSDHDYAVYNVLLNQNVSTVYLGVNVTPDICIEKTILFWQQGGGGYTVAPGAWPTMKWENGILPIFDTSVGGVTSIELLYPYDQSILGVQ